MSHQVASNWAGRIVASATLGCLVACGQPSSSTTDTETASAIQIPIPSSQVGLVNKISRSTSSIPFLGTRVYRLFDGAPLGAPELSYREEVASDGAGQFSIEVLDLITPTMLPSDEAIQLQLLSARGGLLYQYRGFAIRDLVQFLDNFTLVDLQSTVTIAGIAAAEYEVLGATTRWTLAVDTTTGVVLRAVEEDLTGEFLSSIEFESIDYAPDLSTVAWHQSSILETQLALNDPSPFTFDVLNPVLIPNGYQVVEFSQLTEPVTGSVWAKRTYTNGVDMLFFLQTDQAAPVDLATPYPANQVSSSRVGSWRVLDGQVSGQRVILMGKVTDSELAQLMQSSL